MLVRAAAGSILKVARHAPHSSHARRSCLTCTACEPPISGSGVHGRDSSRHGDPRDAVYGRRLLQPTFGPILARNCFESAHGADDATRTAGLRLDESAGAYLAAGKWPKG